MVSAEKAPGMVALEQFLKESSVQDFRPLAYYDKHLDCIRVQIKDCSFTEERINRFFTLWYANHTKSPEFIGFSIKGINHLFVSLWLPKSGPVRLAQILDEIVKHYADQTIKRIVKQIRQRFKSILQLPVDEITDALPCAHEPSDKLKSLACGSH